MLTYVVSTTPNYLKVPGRSIIFFNTSAIADKLIGEGRTARSPHNIFVPGVPEQKATYRSTLTKPKSLERSFSLLECGSNDPSSLYQICRPYTEGCHTEHESVWCEVSVTRRRLPVTSFCGLFCL